VQSELDGHISQSTQRMISSGENVTRQTRDGHNTVAGTAKVACGARPATNGLDAFTVMVVTVPMVARAACQLFSESITDF
jgi:hypothetical protein